MSILDQNMTCQCWDQLAIARWPVGTGETRLACANIAPYYDQYVGGDDRTVGQESEISHALAPELPSDHRLETRGPSPSSEPDLETAIMNLCPPGHLQVFRELRGGERGVRHFRQQSFGVPTLHNATRNEDTLRTEQEGFCYVFWG